jgi:hypothetical protein
MDNGSWFLIYSRSASHVNSNQQHLQKKTKKHHEDFSAQQPELKA